MTQILRSANDDGFFATQSLSKFCTKFHRVLLWFAKKLGALCVFLHRDSPNFFLILIALIRDTPRHFAFFLCEPCEKTLRSLRLNLHRVTQSIFDFDCVEKSYTETIHFLLGALCEKLSDFAFKFYALLELVLDFRPCN